MSDSKEEIMEATCSALKKHGYRDLSIQKIANEFEKSKSLIYHHYDGKDELLLDFMDLMLERYEEECQIGGEDMNAEEKFEKAAFMGFEEEEGAKTFIEIRAQSVRDERYLERFEKFSEKYRDRIKDLLEEGDFQEADYSQIAEFIVSVNNEAVFRKAEGRSTEKLRNELENYLHQTVEK